MLNDWVSRATKPSSNFVWSLNSLLWKLFWWFRRAQLGAGGDWQLHRDNAPTTCITSYAVFLWNIKSPRWLRPPTPRFGALQLLAFPKTKITCEKEELSDHQWDSRKDDGGVDGDWENCVRSQGAYFEGDWGMTVLCTMFLVSCIFFYKCLCFSYYMAGYLLDRPCLWNYIVGNTVDISQ